MIRSTGSWYDVRDNDGHIYRARLKGKFKIKGLKVTNPIAVGDRVQFEVEDKIENTAIIIDIEPRENYIIRQSVHKTAHGHILAANVDQAVLLATLTMPRTSLGFIDRFLVTAEAFRIPTTIVFNKADILNDDGLAYQQEIIDLYEKIGYNCLITAALEGTGVDEFKALLDNKVTLLSGHSGVGKSTLVNAISPDLNLRTSEVSTFANKGVHTTTFAENVLSLGRIRTSSTRRASRSLGCPICRKRRSAIIFRKCGSCSTSAASITACTSMSRAAP